MKITKQQLRRVIQEELTQVLREVEEADWTGMVDDPAGPQFRMPGTLPGLAAADQGTRILGQDEKTAGARFDTASTDPQNLFRGEKGDPYEYMDMGHGRYAFRDTGTPGSEFQMAKGGATGAIDKLRQTGQSGYQAPAAAATVDNTKWPDVNPRPDFERRTADTPTSIVGRPGASKRQHAIKTMQDRDMGPMSARSAVTDMRRAAHTAARGMAPGKARRAARRTWTLPDEG
jgi:hypothetical protein